MHKQSLAIIPEKAVIKLAKWDWVIEAVTHALQSKSTGTAVSFPVTLGRGSKSGTIVGAKSGLLSEKGVLGLKLGTYWPDNAQQDKPAHASTSLLLDDRDGLPVAVINSRFLNGMRTAAANAVAVNYLARSNAKRLAVFGAGSQARFEVAAVRRVRDIEQVWVVNRSPDNAKSFVDYLHRSGVAAEVASAEHAVLNADLITTVTASKAPLFEDTWVRPNTHISTMGSDTPGKQELPPKLFNRADLFADAREQSKNVGEFQHATIDQKTRIFEIGELVNGDELERRHNVSIFDSSGVGLQDVAVSAELVRRAKLAGLANEVEF